MNVLNLRAISIQCSYYANAYSYSLSLTTASLQHLLEVRLCV